MIDPCFARNPSGSSAAIRRLGCSLDVVRWSRTHGRLTTSASSPSRMAKNGAWLRLAALDSSVVPTWPQLLVEIDGELRVAMSINDGAVIADPFYPTLELIGLLRAHAAASARPGRGRRRAGALRFSLQHG